MAVRYIAPGSSLRDRKRVRSLGQGQEFTFIIHDFCRPPSDLVGQSLVAASNPFPRKGLWIRMAKLDQVSGQHRLPSLSTDQFDCMLEPGPANHRLNCDRVRGGTRSLTSTIEIS